MAMEDDLTLGELGRRITAGLSDIKEDIRDVGKRLDEKVSFERYQLEREALKSDHQQLVERVRAIEAARENEAAQRVRDQKAAEDQRRTDRRWFWSALVIPAVLMLMQVYLATKGAGS